MNNILRRGTVTRETLMEKTLQKMRWSVERKSLFDELARAAAGAVSGEESDEEESPPPPLPVLLLLLPLPLPLVAPFLF